MEPLKEELERRAAGATYIEDFFIEQGRPDLAQRFAERRRRGKLSRLWHTIKLRFDIPHQTWRRDLRKYEVLKARAAKRAKDNRGT